VLMCGNVLYSTAISKNTKNEICDTGQMYGSVCQFREIFKTILRDHAHVIRDNVNSHHIQQISYCVYTNCSELIALNISHNSYSQNFNILCRQIELQKI
jgi:hypothetical protein